MHKPSLYRIIYSSPSGEYTVYIGRSNKDLTRRLRHHFVSSHKFQKKMELCEKTRVEIAEFETVADMYVAEIVYINIEKPPLNVDDKAQDELTLQIDLSAVRWADWGKAHLLEKWRKEI